MKKGKFIYGDTGKTLLSKIFAELYVTTLFLSQKQLIGNGGMYPRGYAYWEYVTPDTDLIVVEEYISHRRSDQYFLSWMENGITLNEGHRIYPDLILISQAPPSELIAKSCHFHLIKMGAKDEADCDLFNLNKKIQYI